MLSSITPPCHGFSSLTPPSALFPTLEMLEYKKKIKWACFGIETYRLKVMGVWVLGNAIPVTY